MIPVLIDHATIIGDPGVASREESMFVVKVYFKIENSPWALALTEPVSEAFELPASDWPGRAKRSSQLTLMFLTQCSFPHRSL